MNIYKTEEIQNYTIKQLKEIDNALVAAAFKIRDNARANFVNNGQYSGISKFKDAIMLGKLENSKITVHGFGYNDADKELYKARFFILGTQYRKQKKSRGKPLAKPFTKGYISNNDAIDKATAGSEHILDKYIDNALKNG